MTYCVAGSLALLLPRCALSLRRKTQACQAHKSVRESLSHHTVLPARLAIASSCLTGGSSGQRGCLSPSPEKAHLVCMCVLPFSGAQDQTAAEPTPASTQGKPPPEAPPSSSLPPTCHVLSPRGPSSLSLPSISQRLPAAPPGRVQPDSPLLHSQGSGLATIQEALPSLSSSLPPPTEITLAAGVADTQAGRWKSSRTSSDAIGLEISVRDGLAHKHTFSAMGLNEKVGLVLCTRCTLACSSWSLTEGPCKICRGQSFHWARR